MEPEIVIKSFPLIKFWKKGVLGSVIILLTVTLVYLITKSLIFTGIAFFLITIPSSGFFIPAYYFFYDTYLQKKELGHVIEMNYESFSSFSIGTSGVELVKRGKRKKMEQLFIPEEGLRLELKNFLKDKINEK